MIHKLIEKEAKKKFKSMTDFADVVNMSKSHMSRFLNGKQSIYSSKIDEMLKVLNINLIDILNLPLESVKTSEKDVLYKFINETYVVRVVKDDLLGEKIKVDYV